MSLFILLNILFLFFSLDKLNFIYGKSVLVLRNKHNLINWDKMYYTEYKKLKDKYRENTGYLV